MQILRRDEFPPLLKRTDDWEKLYLDGNPELLAAACVSVVGSREVTEEGEKRTKAIVRLMVNCGYCIVSGLALGVDAIAHETAMLMGGRTIAVIGTPINQVYPLAHSRLQARIAQKGLVVSQFAPGTKVGKRNFPQRNRLMAAMSSLTIVADAGPKSGTRHQVAAALEFGNYVALPASLASQDFPWVASALSSEKTVVLWDLADLSPFLM